MILLKAIGEPIEKLRHQVARGLIALGAGPNVLTVVGFLINVGAGVCFAFGYFRWAVALIIFSSAFDMLDGTVARLSGKTTHFGAFLDSSLDRYGDIAIFGGVIVYFMRAGDNLAVVLGVVALLGSLLISYTRARAECFIDSCKVGFFERGERLVTLMCGALTWNVPTALWILAFATQWTVVIRIHHTWRTLAGRPVPPANTVAGQLYHILFWDFNRGSLQFDVLAVVTAACALWLPL